MSLNILHHKSWHVWNKDTLAKIDQDEKEHKEELQLKQDEKNKELGKNRLEDLRKRAAEKRGEIYEGKQQEEEKEEEKINERKQDERNTKIRQNRRGRKEESSEDSSSEEEEREEARKSDRIEFTSDKKPEESRYSKEQLSDLFGGGHSAPHVAQLFGVSFEDDLGKKTSKFDVLTNSRANQKDFQKEIHSFQKEKIKKRKMEERSKHSGGEGEIDQEEDKVRKREEDVQRKEMRQKRFKDERDPLHFMNLLLEQKKRKSGEMISPSMMRPRVEEEEIEETDSEKKRRKKKEKKEKKKRKKEKKEKKKKEKNVPKTIEDLRREKMEREALEKKRIMQEIPSMNRKAFPVNQRGYNPQYLSYSKGLIRGNHNNN